MICQVCGTEAPTKYVEFYQNIGALVVRYSEHVKGNLCKPCIHKRFWKYTLVDLSLGWWGTISFIVTPFFILNNVVRYITCLFMEPPGPGAAPPQLTDAAIEKIKPHTELIAQRLNRGDPFAEVAEDVAMRATVTPGQVALYVQALVAAPKRAENR